MGKIWLFANDSYFPLSEKTSFRSESRGDHHSTFPRYGELTDAVSMGSRGFGYVTSPSPLISSSGPRHPVDIGPLLSPWSWLGLFDALCFFIWKRVWCAFYCDLGWNILADVFSRAVVDSGVLRPPAFPLRVRCRVVQNCISDRETLSYLSFDVVFSPWSLDLWSLNAVSNGDIVQSWSDV